MEAEVQATGNVDVGRRLITLQSNFSGECEQSFLRDQRIFFVSIELRSANEPC